MAETRHHAPPARRAPARRSSVAAASLRRLDWVLLARGRPRSSATASGRSAGSRGSTSRATPTTSCRQASPSALGAVGLVVGDRSSRPSVYATPLARPLRRDDRAACSSCCSSPRPIARLAALDRHRLLPVPAVRVREGALRARARRRSWPSGHARIGELRTVLAGRRARLRSPIAARVPAARPRHGARLRGGARRRSSSSPASRWLHLALLAILAASCSSRRALVAPRAPGSRC